MRGGAAELRDAAVGVTAVQFQRDQLLYSEADKIVRGIKLIQGTAKEPRQFSISRDGTPPTADGASIPVWIQDGSKLESKIRRVLLPKSKKV